MRVQWWIRWLIYLSLFGAIVRWLIRGVLSSFVVFFILVVFYLNAPSILGVEPLGPFELIEQFSQNLELLVAAVGVVIAIVTAKGYLDSKRLDMRLSAAADLQGLAQKLGDRANKRVQLAEVLVKFSGMLESKEFLEASMEQREGVLGDNLAGLHVAYGEDKNGMSEMWKLVNEGISLSQKHGIALQNSLIAFLSHRKAMSEIEQLAQLCSFGVPETIDDFEYLDNWFRNTNHAVAKACALEGTDVAMRASMWLGSASGALGKGVFSPSGGVALIMLKDLGKIWRTGNA